MNRYTVELVIVTELDPTLWIGDALYRRLSDGEELFSVDVTNVEEMVDAD